MSFATASTSATTPSRYVQRWTAATTKMAVELRAVAIFPAEYIKDNRDLIMWLCSPVPATLTNDTILEVVNAALTPSSIKVALSGCTRKFNLCLSSRVTLGLPPEMACFATIACVLRLLGLEVSIIQTYSCW